MFHLRLQVRSIAALSIASSVGFCAATVLSSAVVESKDDAKAQFLDHHAAAADDVDPTAQEGLKQRKHENTITKDSSDSPKPAKPSNNNPTSKNAFLESGASLSKHKSVVNSDRDGCPVQKLMKYLPTGVQPYVQSVYDVVKPIKQGMRERMAQLRENGCGPCKRRRVKDLDSAEVSEVKAESEVPLTQDTPVGVVETKEMNMECLEG